MSFEKDILENKAKLRMLELKLDAVINILIKEGIMLKEELDLELNNLIKKGEKEQ